jgi:hypothetical protein
LKLQARPHRETNKAHGRKQKKRSQIDTKKVGIPDSRENTRTAMVLRHSLVKTVGFEGCPRMLFLFTSLLLLLAPTAFCQKKDYQIYGLFDSFRNPLNPRRTNVVYSRCFNGVGLMTCVPKQADDDYVRNYDLPYIATIPEYAGSTYCVQCCGKNPDHIDVWDLYCPVDAGTRSIANLYGYELRLARNRDSQDETVITCPLKRSACTYSETGETLSCNRAADNTSLAGYTARLKVREWDQLFGYWRGIESCEIETIEIPGQLPIGYQFHEKLILDHEPLKYAQIQIEKDFSKLLSLLILLVAIIYGLLYWCRRKRCPYCQKKLVLAWNLCFTCQFYGVQMPDMVLLEALEAKGEALQGPIPERFPGAKMIVSLFRTCYSAICGRCCDSSAAKRKVHSQVVYEANVEMAMTTKSMNLHVFSIGDEEDTSPIDEEDEEVSLKVKSKHNKQVNEKNLPKSSSPHPMKYQKLKEKWRQERLQEMESNPNVLDYDPELIFQAVDHPKFLGLKPRLSPPRPKVKDKK